MTTYNEQNRESPDAIKADIERTRSQMSNKIDTLQERLHPDNLKHQAQEAVQGALQEGSDAVKSYIQEHSSELRDTVLESFKRNPIPTALVGLGLGWILLESFGSREKEYSARREWVSARDESRYPGSQGYGADPNRSSRASAGTAQPAYSGWARSPGEFSGGYSGGYSGPDEGANGHSHTVGDKVQQMGGAVKEKANQAVGQIQDTAEQIQDTAAHVVSQVSDKTQELGHQAREQVARLGDQTGRQMQQAGQQAYHVLEANPLAVGAAALALGAVIGLLLPATRQENQMVGDLRDQVVEKGKAVAENVVQRVQEVVEEVKPEVEQMASRVMQDLKPEVEQLGQKVADDLKQAGQQALNTEVKSSEVKTGEVESPDHKLVREPATPLG